MQKRFILGTGIALAALSAAYSAGDSRAGVPAREENGNFMVLDAEVYPPRTSTGPSPRGRALDIHILSGNILTGEPAIGNNFSRSLELRFPRGMKANFKAFPVCREDALRRRGPSACSRRSLIARGRSLVDVRPVIPDFLDLQATVFNGRDSSGSRVILLWGKSSLGVSGVIPFKLKRPGRTGGWRFVSEVPKPDPGATATLRVVGGDLSFPDSSVRVRGKRVHLFEAPRRCRRYWTFQYIATRFDGRRLVASDRVPCAD